MSSQFVTLEMVREAEKNLQNIVRHTPTIQSTALSNKTGAEIFLKLENLQYTGAFKFRGSYNKISSLTAEEKARGIMAASSGNHAQGAALAAKLLGIKATVFMPQIAPKLKISNTRAFGAEVVQYGEVYDETLAYTKQQAEETGSILVSSYNDLKIIAGQGTICLEILQTVSDLDIIVAPIGGGGLISGLSATAKLINPEIKVIGVQTNGIPSMKASIENGRLTTVNGPKSIADGIMVETPGDITFAHAQKFVDDIVTVSDAEIKAAIRQLLQSEKQVAEGAGAAATAAVMHEKINGLQGKKVAVIISGGNIDLDKLAGVLNE